MHPSAVRILPSPSAVAKPMLSSSADPEATPHATLHSHSTLLPVHIAEPTPSLLPARRSQHGNAPACRVWPETPSSPSDFLAMRTPCASLPSPRTQSCRAPSL